MTRRLQIADFKKAPLLQIILIIIMSIAVRAVWFSHLTDDTSIQLLEDVWRWFAQISEAAAVDNGVWSFAAIQTGLAELRAEQGLFRIVHLLPFGFSLTFTGESVLSGYLFPTVAFIFSIFLVYKLSSPLWDRETGIIAALLWSLFPTVLDYSSSSLFTSAYFALSLASLFCLLWAKEGGLWLGYVASALFVVITSISIPILGIILSILFLIIGLGGRINVKNTQHWLKARLRQATIAGTIFLIIFTFYFAEGIWQFFTDILQQREFLIFLPLFFFSAIWSSSKKLPVVTPTLLGFGVSLIIYFGLLIWSPPSALVGENIDGLGELFVLLPLTILAASVLASGVEKATAWRLTFIFSLGVTILALWQGWERAGQAHIEMVNDILQIVAGIGFFCILAAIFLITSENSRWMHVGFFALFSFVALSILYYTISRSAERNILNENALTAAILLDNTVFSKDVYVCPGELGSRMSYVHGFGRDTGADNENLYQRLPRNVEDIEDGILVWSMDCPEEVRNLVFALNPRLVIGSTESSRLIIVDIGEMLLNED